mmetsp:Transcript_10137/g.18257  ORF Transcript_10137/g.18257 Transcript_10137/m.18257 type:complete len:533 (+) Transcript_10137:1602-3200(+)
MNCISVKHAVNHVETNTTHVFVTNDTFLGSPLEGSNNRVLDFVEVLHCLGLIHKQVRTSGLRSEAPNLLCSIFVHAVLFRQDLRPCFRIVTRSNLTFLDCVSESFRKRFSIHKETIVLVWRFRQTHTILCTIFNTFDGLAIRHHWVRYLDFSAIHKVLLQILEANLNVQLSASSNHVFTALLGKALHQRIRLCKAFQTFNKLWQVRWVLWFHCDTHDRRYRVLHIFQRESLLQIRQSTRLDKELIQTNETDGVSTGNGLYRLGTATHHQHRTLNVLDSQILLGSRHVVGSHNADLLSSLYSSREHTTVRNEATLIHRGDHFGDVQHQWTVGITISDAICSEIIHWSFVQSVNTILLGLCRRRKMQNHHFQQSLICRNPLLQNSLHQRLSTQFFFLRLQLDIQRLQELYQLRNLVVHRKIDNFLDRLDDKLIECSVTAISSLGPLLFRLVEETVTPQTLSHLDPISTKLLCVHSRKASQSECPPVQTSRERNCSFLWKDLKISKRLVLISSHDNVCVLDDTLEILVHIFCLQL